MERREIAIKATAVTLGVIFILAVLTNSQVLSPEDFSTSEESTEVIFVSEGETKAEITAEIADTPQKRQKGLMNRTELEKDHGMLFIFPDERERAFWMKNTYIPLDMIFVNRDKEIVNIRQADPEPNTSDEDLTRYRSEEPAMYVIEVNQGFSENNSIETGDKINTE